MMKKDRECLQSMIQRRIDNLPSWYEGLYIEGSRDAYELVLQDIDQLDEPEVLTQELPAIPKFVADWIEEIKKNDKTLVFAISYIYEENEGVNQPDEEINKIYCWIESYDNEETFARAWLDGYEVEEEPLYYALIKGHELCSDLFKYWNCKAYNSGDLLIGSKYPKASCINRMTKDNWSKIGINDSNADFVKVKE